MDNIAILLVSNIPIMRDGLRNLINQNQNVSLAAEVTTAPRAIEWMQHSFAHVVLMDIHPPDTNSFTIVHEITQLSPATKVLVLTTYEDTRSLVTAILAGAKGYLVYRRLTPEDLIKAIHKVVANETVIDSPAATDALIEITAKSRIIPRKRECQSITPLTRREEEVLNLIADGKGNTEIARTLFIGEKTVKNHITNIYSKLKVKSRYEAINIKLFGDMPLPLKKPAGKIDLKEDGANPKPAACQEAIDR